MRKLLLIILFQPLFLFAQTAEFGFFSLQKVMEALPEYQNAQNEYNTFVELCDKEIAFNEAELTRYYVSFLDGQNTFPEPILRKRQKELQEMVNRSVIFRDQLKETAVQVRDSLFAPVMQNIDAALERVCMHNKLAYAIDTDKASYRFINPNYGIDITGLVIDEVVSPKIELEQAPGDEQE